MGSIPVAGAKKAQPQMWLRLFGTLTKKPLCAQRRIGFAFCEQGDGSSLTRAASKNIRLWRNSRCFATNVAAPFWYSHEETILRTAQNWVRISRARRRELTHKSREQKYSPLAKFPSYICVVFYNSLNFVNSG